MLFSNFAFSFLCSLCTTAAEPPIGIVQADTIPISLARARELALTRNPAFLADREALPAARGRLRQAQAVAPNPEIDFRSRGAPDLGSGGFEASITQGLELTGQRGARVRAGRSGLARAEAQVRDAVRQTLWAVSDAFHTARAARERVTVARQVADLNEQLVRATRIQLTEGEISRLESNLAEIELGRARALVLTESRAARDALRELERLTGTPGAVPDSTDGYSASIAFEEMEIDSLVALALGQRPDLVASRAAFDQATALESLTRREAFPTVRVGAVAERDEVAAAVGASATRIGLVISTALPFWNRNQGAVAEQEAVANEMRLRRDALELSVRTEVCSSRDRYVAAIEEARVYAQDVLEPARANQALLETAFISGKIGLPTLLLLRNQLLDAELSYWDAWLAARSALVELQAVTGTLEADSALDY